MSIPVILHGQKPKLTLEDVGIGNVTWGDLIGLGGLSTILNDNSWEMISKASEKGIASSLWSVGDRKAVTLKGTIGTLDVNGTYYVYIIGFDHNEAIEGKGIHFGCFKDALNGGKDICLIDANYGGWSTDGTKIFNMNHSGNDNSLQDDGGTDNGGWKGCDMRYDILGSTDRKGQDASVNTAINPVANTFMAALPADLRAVMKPMIKYTDNVGSIISEIPPNAGEGSTDYESNVTSSIDYLPLLAPFETFGSSRGSNQHEKKYQAQYSYYKGNSADKYHSNDATFRKNWWYRSPYFENYAGADGCFCDYGGDDAGLTYPYASYSLGIAPIFKV